MNKIFSLFACCFCQFFFFSQVSWAEDMSEVTLESAQLPGGRYYLKNVASQQWLSAGNSWGTQASLLPHAEYVTLHTVDGYYTIETQEDNSGGNGSNWFYQGWMDSYDRSLLNIMLGSDGYYRLIDADNGSVPGYDGETTVLYATASGINACWQIFSEEEMYAELAKAQSNNPVDATWKILAPNFGRNNVNVSAWVISNNCYNWTLSGGNNVNNCAESWHSTFDIYQTLTDMPNGTYTLKAQGFYRQDGSDYENMPVFYINEQTAVFPLKEGSENSMSDASEAFSSGRYAIAPITVFVTDGTIRLGVKSDNLTMWCIWDNFELTYYGQDYLYIDNYDELLDKAQGLLNTEDISEKITSALVDAIEMSIDTEDERAAAIDALTSAINMAEAYIIAQSKLGAMQTLIESTNFYTAEAFNTYYQQWANKMEEGSLTKAEASKLQDPYDVTSWHADVTVDDFLLSVWDTNPDFQNAPYYVNTWSVEGTTDGTDFVVPFIEYWTNDYSVLETRTLTATLTGLEKGTYDVTLLARVRLSNYYNEAPRGITMQVNGDDAVSLTDGQNVADRMYIGTYTATGFVGEDGTMELTITVNDENNISWLSFKDVNYVYVCPDDPKAIDVADWTILKEAYASMGGESWNRPWTFGDEPTTARDLPGVKVSGGKVVGISLPNNNVTGSFPASLLSLESLSTLDLSGNALSGDAAQAVVGISNTGLTTLDISDNAFTGNIGAFAENLRGLTTLLAAGNQFETVNPAISPVVTTLDLSRQTIDTNSNLSLADMRSPETLFANLPEIVIYDHAIQNANVDNVGLLLVDNQTSWNVEVNSVSGSISAICPSGQNVFFGNSGSTFTAKVIDSGTTFPLTLTFEDGDCNFDGVIDVLDLQADVNYIFNEYSQLQPYNFTAANLWVEEAGEQQINLQDIIVEVNLLLSQVHESPAPSRRGIVSRYASDIIVEDDYDAATMQINSEGCVVLSTTCPVAAFDITIVGASAFELAETLRQQGFVCATRLQADGLHVVAYSLNGALLPVGETAVGIFNTSQNVNTCITRASLSDRGARRISVSLNQQITSIEETEIDESKSLYDVFDLMGRKVAPSLFNSSTPQLRRGIYVKQGQKIIVK